VYIENGLSLSGKYSIQTMIFRFLCAFVWFKNIEKMLLQVTSGFLQFESTIGKLLTYSRVKNKLLPRIRTFREITFFMLCVTRIFKSNFEC
jgi:hypothetical protein